MDENEKKNIKKNPWLNLTAKLCVVIYAIFIGLHSETTGKRSYEVQCGKTEHQTDLFM